MQIDQRGGPIVVYETPFDKDLAKINGELAKTTCAYGDGKAQLKANAQKEAALALPAAAAADRAAFFGNVGGGAAGNAKLDLVEAIKKKLVKLEDVKKEHLPPEMQKMTVAEQKAHIEKLDQARVSLNKQANELAQQRARFIAQKQAEDQKNKTRDSFDNQVLQILQTQARRIDVRYAEDANRK